MFGFDGCFFGVHALRDSENRSDSSSDDLGVATSRRGFRSRSREGDRVDTVRVHSSFLFPRLARMTVRSNGISSLYRSSLKLDHL